MRLRRHSSTGNVVASGQVRMAAVDAVIIRADGTREPLGTVAYYHRNPLRRWLWRLTHKS